MTAALSKDATTHLVRCSAYLDETWRPLRNAFLTPAVASAIFAARRAGLSRLRSLNGDAKNWKRNQRAREALTKQGLMSGGDMTAEGRRLARSWLWPYKRQHIFEAVARMFDCMANDWCRRDRWVPECFVAACPWGGDSGPLAMLQACLAPALVDRWLASRSSVLGHVFYQIDPSVDPLAAINESLPVESELREDLFDVYDNEVRAVRNWLLNTTERAQEMGELPMIVSAPMLDAEKRYDDVPFPPLFPSTETDVMTEPWAQTFSIIVPLPRCPFCGSPSHVRVRTNARGDGASERLCICKKCSRRYRIVVDPALVPVSGMLPTANKTSRRIKT